VASNYPTSLDTFAQPTDPTTAALSSAGAGGNTRPHLEHHRDLGDVLEEAQKKLGIGPGCALCTSHLTGVYNVQPDVTGNVTHNTLNRMEIRRYDIPYGVTVTQVAFWVITAAASSFIRPVVYSDDGTGCYPASLLVDVGQVDTSTTGLKTPTAFSAVDVGGVTWWGSVVQGAAAVTVQGFTNNGRGMAVTALTGNTAQAGYYQDSVSGTPPGTFTSTRNFTTGVCRLAYK
jgi:hypothetical protein